MSTSSPCSYKLFFRETINFGRVVHKFDSNFPIIKNVIKKHVLLYNLETTRPKILLFLNTTCQDVGLAIYFFSFIGDYIHGKLCYTTSPVQRQPQLCRAPMVDPWLDVAVAGDTRHTCWQHTSSSLEFYPGHNCARVECS